MLIQQLSGTTLVVDEVIGGLERGDILEGGHRVTAICSSSEIELCVNHPHDIIPGKVIGKVGSISKL